MIVSRSSVLIWYEIFILVLEIYGEIFTKKVFVSGKTCQQWSAHEQFGYSKNTRREDPDMRRVNAKRRENKQAMYVKLSLGVSGAYFRQYHRIRLLCKSSADFEKYIYSLENQTHENTVEVSFSDFLFNSPKSSMEFTNQIYNNLSNLKYNSSKC